MKQQITPQVPSLSWHNCLFLMVTPEFRCRDGIYKQHLASNMKLLATTVLCLQPPVESRREHPFQGTLLWCVILHPSPLSNHCCTGRGRDGIFDKVFFHKAREIGTASCFGMLFALRPPKREHWQGFVFYTPPPVIHVAAEGDRRGINIASSEPKLLRAYFVLNKITL